jgi:dihydrofolate reductase
MSKISIIVAATKDLVIGKDNGLPWNLPSDIKHFKNITEGSYVIMGRNTWRSIPEKYRPLPNRKNIVISNKYKFEAVGATVVNDLETLLSVLKNDTEETEVFVIGGGKIYKDAFKYADKLYLTQILEDFEGDTYLEGFNYSEWCMIDSSQIKKENDINYRFTIFERIEDESN